MFSPGQLIKQERLRRGWTQQRLASDAEIAQGALSKFESDRAYPTWPTLLRLLAVMGLQPRVVAEPCDLEHHADTALVRASDDERWAGVPPAWRGREADLAAMLRPNVCESRPRMYHLLPVLDLLEGLEFVLVGRIALRMHGVGCSVPRVEALVRHDPSPPGAAAALWEHISARLSFAEVSIWSPETERYHAFADAATVADIAVATAGAELCFRTRETGTELVVALTPEPLPPHVTSWNAGRAVPLLAMSEFSRWHDPRVADALASLAS